MANLPRAWSRFRELDQLRRDFDNVLERFLGGHAEHRAQSSAVTPAVESFVRDGKLVVRADLAGVDPNDVEITLNGDRLLIRAKRERSHEEEPADFFHRELCYGTFERELRLPEGIETEEVKASYRNGVLELTVPVRQGAKARKVPVEVVGKS